MLGFITYYNNVFAGFAQGENVFDLDKNNAAFPKVAKKLSIVLRCV